MTELSPNIAERARKIETLILQRLSEKTQVAIALEVGMSEPKMSRFKNEYLNEIVKVLAALGLRVVPDDSLEVSKTELDALEALAFKYLEIKKMNKH